MLVAFVNPQGNFDAAGSYLTAHPDFGGQLVYVRELARALAALGHEAHILTRQIADPSWPEFSAQEDGYPEQPGVRILRFPCGPAHFLPKEKLWPHLREWVGHIAAWYGAQGRWPDLWTGHYADGGLSAALLSEQSGVPFTFTGHSLGACKLESLLDEEGVERLPALDRHYNLGARLQAELASMARTAVVIVSSTAERYVQYGHPAYRRAIDVQDSGRFARVPPGVDLAVFGPRNRSARESEIRKAIRAALARDLAPGRQALPAVVAWSRLDPKKNHLGLVRAFAASTGLRERANLVMITRGLDDPLHDLSHAPSEERAVLRAVVREVDRSGLRGKVSAFSLEGQDALAALHRWTAETGGVFCLPSHHEPFSLSLLEAMGSGVPVVATSNGGPAEITDGGKSGLLANPHDYQELAAQLVRLLSDPAAWRHYSQAGRRRVLTLYNWRCTAQGYIQLASEIQRGERADDASFELPAFVRRRPPVRLPRLHSWPPDGAVAAPSVLSAHVVGSAAYLELPAV
ncbi:MAG: glycosyltransferase [Chloroflexota bacterium]|nr:glycosyltransferase [Chloroflexota bacterium]